MDAAHIPFTDEDERKIASAATWGMIVAITSISTGAISLLMQLSVMSSLPSGMKALVLVPVVQAAVTILLNLWLLQASLAFRKVALTDEADQEYLLAGFRKLRAYFMVQVILILVAIGLGLLASFAVFS
ncbi:MAG: hypothetical protein K0V04_16305 [Deltaproteobacteria bacterium]|nr:hypothetical protein [Deltaproteobacteria bacterium]